MTKTLVERLRERGESEAADRIERLEAALRPFGDVADLLDAETEGVSDTDEMELYLFTHLMYLHPVAQFRTARAALNGE